MYLEQRQQGMLQLYLSDQQFHCLLRCGLYQEVWQYINQNNSDDIETVIPMIFPASAARYDLEM